jgi:L-amino acid N-acyltransferase YncA
MIQIYPKSKIINTSHFSNERIYEHASMLNSSVLLRTSKRGATVMVREIKEEDYEVFKSLFNQAFSEYLEFLKHENPQQYEKELGKRREITRSGFEFYLGTGSSFVAEENGKAVGYVASQKVPSMHGVDLWIEYIVVQREFRRRRVGLALLQRLIDYAASSSIDRIYAFINPDNEPSMRLHSKADFSIEDWKIAVHKVNSKSNKNTS